MSGLSSLLAYEEEEEDEEGDEKLQPLQPLHAAAHIEQQAAPHPAALGIPPPPPEAGAQPAVDESAESEPEANAVAQSEPTQKQASTAAPQPATRDRSSAPLITPALSRLIARLPPIPAATLPATPPDAARAYFSSLPPHLHGLLHKRRATQSASLVAQLTALPAFHNPAILQRILAAQRIDQHDVLWTRDEAEGEAEEDSVGGMRRQDEREQKERAQEDRTADERVGQRQRQKQVEAGEKASTSLENGSLSSWRERELRKRNGTAMHSQPAHPAESASDGVSATNADGFSSSANVKLQEAMRRAAEISKRLRQT